MKIKLTQEEIENILAATFGTSLNKVHINVYSDYEGYGTNEHEVLKVEATIDTKYDYSKSKNYLTN